MARGLTTLIGRGRGCRLELVIPLGRGRRGGGGGEGELVLGLLPHRGRLKTMIVGLRSLSYTIFVSYATKAT